MTLAERVRLGILDASQALRLLAGGHRRHARNYMIAAPALRRGWTGSTFSVLPLSTGLPRCIEVEPTTSCTLKCLKCEHTHWHVPQRNMTHEEFLHIARQFPRLCGVSFAGSGNSLEQPEFIQMLEYCHERDLYTQFRAPLLFLTRKRAERIVQVGVDRIVMTIDAATRATYDALQPGSEFKRVIANASYLVECRCKAGAPVPELTFVFTVMGQNLGEMPQFLELVNDITIADTRSVRRVAFIPLLAFEQTQELAVTVPKSLIRETREKARRLGRFAVTFGGLGGRHRAASCRFWAVPFITVEGNYYPCRMMCGRNRRRQADKHVFGNLFQDDFREIWNSKEAAAFRFGLRRATPPELCRVVQCPRCAAAGDRAGDP